MATNPERDEISGVDTTGHEWDGIKELNNPLPKWWLYIFYATVVWAIGYMIAMPAIPLVSDYTKGVLGKSDRAELWQSIDAAKKEQAVYLDRIEQTDVAGILADSELRTFATQGGRAAFNVNCSQCHGLGAGGFVGYPNLNDDDWLWGGTAEEIKHTIAYGIRSDHDETHSNEMPAFLKDEILDRTEIAAVTEYVFGLSNSDADTDKAQQGAAIYEEQCVACHGEDAKGNHELGSPNLADAIWLYGGDRESISRTIANSRSGVMPAWTGRLGDTVIKQLTVYVHSLGGGE